MFSTARYWVQCGDTSICDGIFYLVRSQQAKSLDEIKLSQIKFCSYFLLQKEYLEKSLYAWYLRPGKSDFDILTPEIHLLWPVCLFFIVCLFVCLFKIRFLHLPSWNPSIVHTWVEFNSAVEWNFHYNQSNICKEIFQQQNIS